jgi:O-antigen ligase
VVTRAATADEESAISGPFLAQGSLQRTLPPMTGDSSSSVPAGSKLALTVLVVLVVVSPWPFGSAHPRTTQAIALITLATALGAVLWHGWRPQLQLPPRVLLWSAFGLWALAVFQLIPLPEGLHRWLAPGSAAVWYPDVPAAAAVLGPGPHPVSLYPDATRRWLVFATGLAALALAAAPALREQRLLLQASITVVASGVLVATYGLVARLAFGDKLYGFLTVPTIAPFGPFVSKNHFAGYVEMAACLAVGLATGMADEARRGPGRLGWLDSPRAVRVVFAWGAAVALILAVPVSLSRGGTVSLAAGLVAFVLIRIATSRAEGSPRTLAFAAAGLVVAGVAVISVLPPEARSRVATLAATRGGGPDPFRLGVWRDALRLTASSPFLGSGLGAFEDAFPRFKTAAGDQRVQHAENDYIELLAGGGLVGGALTGVLVASILLVGLRGVRAEPHRAACGLRSGAFAGVAALLVHSTFDFNLRIPSNALLFCLLVAMVLQPSTRAAENGAEVNAKRSWLRSSLVLLPLVAVAAVIGFANPWAPRRFDTAPLARTAAPPATALRWRSLESDVIGHLRRRPADAPAWVIFAWLRAPASMAEAAALASWGVELDPEHAALRRAAKGVAGAQVEPPGGAGRPSRTPY